MATTKDSSTTGRSTLSDPPAETLEALRAYYQGEVARVALELRPRFESGELHGWREEDTERMEAEGGSYRASYVPPPWRVEEECGRRFVRASVSRAYVVLLVSPSEPETAGVGWTDHRYHAANAMAWDVIRYARAQGWTTMTSDEFSPGADYKPRRGPRPEGFHGYGRRAAGEEG
jgi:hypothetical protein